MKEKQFTFDGLRYCIKHQQQQIIEGDLYAPLYKFSGSFKDQLPFQGTIQFQPERCMISNLYHYLFKFEGTVDYIEGDYYVTGKGKMTYQHKNGKFCTAQGNFIRSLLHGQGKLYHEDLEQQEGNYLFGELNGYGKMTTKNKQVMEGTFKQQERNYQIHGKVFVRYHDGLEQIAQTVDGNYHGLVKQCKDGLESLHVYKENQIIQSLQLGKKGEVMFPEKDFYMGNVVDGKKEGASIVHKSTGEVVKCVYKNGEVFSCKEIFKPCGDCILFLEQNSDKIYQAKYQYASGDCYVGSINDSLQKHGAGVLTKIEGEVVEGIWQLNMLSEKTKTVIPPLRIALIKRLQEEIPKLLEDPDKIQPEPEQPKVNTPLLVTKVEILLEPKRVAKIEEPKVEEPKKKIPEFSIEKLRRQLREQEEQQRKKKQLERQLQTQSTK